MMAVRVEHLQYQPDYDIVPQAIFWRPLRYFTTAIRHGEDNLDAFDAASFIIGNWPRFDLRTYEGHPAFTVTLYLPFSVEDQAGVGKKSGPSRSANRFMVGLKPPFRL